MPMPSWLPLVLAVQLVISFFAPPIGYGPRTIFLGDLFCFAWCGVLVMQALAKSRAAFRPLFKFFLVSELVILLVYAHGHYRPSLQATLHGIGFYIGDESDLFNPIRELVIAVRFLSWLWAGGIVALIWNRQDSGAAKRALKPIEKSLACSVIIAGGLMALAKLSPQVRELLGTIYRYNPDYEYWRGRMYGVFSSPVEAGAVLALATLLVPGSLNLSRGLKGAAIGFGILGLWLSHTLTAMVAFIVGGTYFLFTAKVPKKHRKFVFGASALLLLCFVGWLLHDPTLAIQKLNDVNARSQTWRVYLPALGARLDYALFGFGFARYPTDNSYLFLLVRGGLFAVSAMVFGVFLKIRKNWKHWSPPTRGAVIYTFLAGAMLDIFIYRHAAVLWIVFGLPLLSRRS